MSSVEEHYERFLAKHYTWMFGVSFEEKVSEQKSLLSHALKTLPDSTEGRVAVDLGSGPGFQSIALAEMGFSPVIAIDTSSKLLDELRSHAHGLALRLHEADIQQLSEIVTADSAAVVVCMGDTLTHLASKTDVSSLFRKILRALASGGKFVLTYRDLTNELQGVERFILVRSDENTVMTCFLEYKNSDSVIVHDLMHTREAEGWTLDKSSYPKLRLGVKWVVQQLKDSGFTVESQESAGRLLQIVAGKP
jgi:SAM-dependent methyltransferase